MRSLPFQNIFADVYQDENGIVRTWGEQRLEEGLRNHHDLMLMLQGIDTERGTKVAGGRGYFLRGTVFFYIFW